MCKSSILTRNGKTNNVIYLEFGVMHTETEVFNTFLFVFSSFSFISLFSLCHHHNFQIINSLKRDKHIYVLQFDFDVLYYFWIVMKIETTKTKQKINFTEYY